MSLIIAQRHFHRFDILFVIKKFFFLFHFVYNSSYCQQCFQSTKSSQKVSQIASSAIHVNYFPSLFQTHNFPSTTNQQYRYFLKYTLVTFLCLLISTGNAHEPLQVPLLARAIHLSSAVHKMYPDSSFILEI